MLIQKQKQGQAAHVVDAVQNVGMLDYIDSDGNIRTDEKQAAVMVRNQSDLASLINYDAGTIAYTAGFGSMWQKSAAGTWEEI